jgi:hypothetical protein
VTIRRKKAKWPWVMLLAVEAALVFWFCGVVEMMKETAERELAAALPAGTDHQAVRSYFRGRGIHVDEDGGKFVGRLRNVNHSLFVQKDLMLVVETDKDGKVARTSVTEYLTGL